VSTKTSTIIFNTFNFFGGKMFTKLKKLSFMLLMMLMIFLTGAGQNTSIAFAAGQNEDIPATPLYPDLAWDNLGPSVRDITISINGDAVSLPGNSYRADKEFSGDIPEDVLNYYSNDQLAQTGWESYDSFENTNGVYRVFYHKTGVYLSVEILKCPDDPTLTCISLWESEQTGALSKPLPNSNEQQGPTAASFSKSSPSNGASSINPASVTLSWDAYYPAPEKYSYCIKEGSECESNDPNWTSSYTRSATLTNLGFGKNYYWQIKAITCVSCVPKIFVYANNGSWWTFTTKAQPTFTISGNAGIAGAILSYTDGTAKTATSGTDGSYSFAVSSNWSGAVTPSKTGYWFTPSSKSYTHVLANQTAQNYTAAAIIPTISGNAGVAGATLSYTDVTSKTATADGNGNYSFPVSYNWSGTVTPSRVGYTFLPSSKTYTNVIGNRTNQNFTTLLHSANINVAIGGASGGNYILPVGASTRASYTVSNGPVRISSTNSAPFLASQQVAYNNGTAWTDFSEIMGLPANQATTAYWFPWYNNIDMNTQIRFANLGSTATNIWITIGGFVQPPIPLAAGQSTRVSYPINNGPVKVESSMGNIIASMRVSYNDGTAWTSFSEVLGMPANQLTTTYWFPWYNNLDMNTQIRFANLGSTATNIWITIGGVVQPPIPLAVGQSTRVSYPINNGPVKVESSMGNIIASMRVAYNDGTAWTSFSEALGLPANQATTAYWFPWYNNVDMNTQIRFANLGSSPAKVMITIGGVLQTPIPLAAGQSTRVSYPINNGPVKVESVDGNIIASMRVAYNNGTAWTSFSEVLGMPANQLTTAYWFPWYNNLDLNTQVLFAVP
jgi:hypothetical protein